MKHNRSEIIRFHVITVAGFCPGSKSRGYAVPLSQILGGKFSFPGVPSYPISQFPGVENQYITNEKKIPFFFTYTIWYWINAPCTLTDTQKGPGSPDEQQRCFSPICSPIFTCFGGLIHQILGLGCQKDYLSSCIYSALYCTWLKFAFLIEPWVTIVSHPRNMEDIL